MKIRRIKVLLAKGWYVAVWCVSYSLFSLICSFASAQKPVDKAVVTKDIKAGDIISGKVTDNEGPMMMVNITERDSDDLVVAHCVTDMAGEFSFRLVNPANRLKITYVGYKTVDTLINSTYYEIRMKENESLSKVDITANRRLETMYGPLPPPINNPQTMVSQAISMDEFEDLALMTDVQDNPQAYGPSAGLDIVYNPGDIIARPLLVLDDKIITADSTAWAGIDITRADYSKEELARLFGVKARKIKSVSYLKRQAAMALWGIHGFNGAIEVQTKKGRK
ncbi:MAG: hypothetical protein J6T97_08240 [Bacteroidaceae bacterium]|nr:hypothetical protein [Bacteroidaceae bacterium]